MDYFISKQIYNLLNNCKLACREMNFTPYIAKIRFNIQFLWKYRYILNWHQFTPILKTESHLNIFDKFIVKPQVTVKDLSEDYVRKYIDVLPVDVIFDKQRSDDLIQYYLEKINKSSYIILKTQNLTPEILLKYRTKWNLSDILQHVKNLPASLIEYMIMTDVEVRGDSVYSKYSFSRYVNIALAANRTLNRSFLEINIKCLSEDTVKKLVSANYINRYFIGYKSSAPIKYDEWLKAYNETQKSDEHNWM